MRWLERHAWWGLLLMTVTMVGFGVGDVLQGAAADRGIPLGLTGLTLEELQAEGPASYRLFDFFTRVNGYSLLLAGLLGTAILLFAFRARSTMGLVDDVAASVMGGGRGGVLSRRRRPR